MCIHANCGICDQENKFHVSTVLFPCWVLMCLLEEERLLSHASPDRAPKKVPVDTSSVLFMEFLVVKGLFESSHRGSDREKATIAHSLP